MNKRLRNHFLLNVFWWGNLIFIWMTIASPDYKHEHFNYEHTHSFRMSFSILITFVLATLNTVAEWRWNMKGFRNKISFRKKLIILFIQQLVFTMFAAFVLYVLVRFVAQLEVADDFRTFIQRFKVIKFWMFAGVAAYALEMVKAIDQKLGPGNLWKMVKGEFREPKEMERIFMFLDLKSATTLAERLGNIKYSQLLQDCFHDVSVVQKYGAEVFQYVGDEVVLVWKKKTGVTSFNCIEAYFAFMERLNSKSEYYMDKFGVVPFFKAGIHIGKVVLAEVGEIKREIAYHGDTINTASRIQGKCNEFDQQLIVSEDLVQEFKQEQTEIKYEFTNLGIVTLKGKDKEVKILGVERV